jgi:hypothetical protein
VEGAEEVAEGRAKTQVSQVFPFIISAMKSRRARCVGYVVAKGQKINALKNTVSKPERKKTIWGCMRKERIILKYKVVQI